jgi:hypothetical protein
MELVLVQLEKCAETLCRCWRPRRLLSSHVLLRGPFSSHASNAARLRGDTQRRPGAKPTTQNGPTPKPGSTALHLEISGMDCADSIPNVARVPRPPPIRHSDRDGLFCWQIPAAISPSPSAIAAYLARVEPAGVGNVSFCVTVEKALRSRDVLAE